MAAAFKTPLAGLYTQLFYANLRYKYRDNATAEKSRRRAFKRALLSVDDRIRARHVIAAIITIGEDVPEID